MLGMKTIHRFLRTRYLLSTKQVFRYHDGVRWRYGDPMQLWRALANHPSFNMETHLELIERGEEPETTNGLKAICEIFQIQPWDPVKRIGLTEGEILSTMLSLVNYFYALKKNFSPGPTLPQPTDSGSSTSADRPEKAGNVLSDSTPTCSAASLERASESSAESEPASTSQ